MLKKIFISTLLLLTVAFSFGQTTLKLKKDGGIYLVPCKINGLDFDLYFDTGASLVSLSLKEAKKLIAAGKLKADDIIGKIQMTIANGQFVNGTIILIRELKVGDLILKDVEAVITESQTAPLLLGQSAIKNFGEFTFDYATETLKISNINKTKSAVVIPKMYETHKNGMTPEQLKPYEEFYKHKSEIIESLVVELAKYKVYQSNGDNHVSLSFDITNNSDYDFSLNKQLMATPVKLVNVVVTVYTEEGKTYTGKEKLTDLLSHNTISTSDAFIDVNIRTNKIKGIKIRVIDLDF